MFDTEPILDDNISVELPTEKSTFNFMLNLKSLLRQNKVTEFLVVPICNYVNDNILCDVYKRSLSTFVNQNNTSLDLLQDILECILKFADFHNSCLDLKTKYNMLTDDIVRQVVLYSTLYYICVDQNLNFYELLNLDNFKKLYFIVSFIPKKLKVNCCC
jgi:hypothetical protein